jgi:pimeloyl-ACP methyl ester carboxylesterase
MGMPETRYARSGDVAIAYQVLGEGPFDVVFAPGTVSHVELYWEAAGMAALLRGVAEHARVIVFDKRGTGLSDRFRPRTDGKRARRTFCGFGVALGSRPGRPGAEFP